MSETATAATPEPVASPAPVVAIRKLYPQRLKLAETERRHYVAIPESGVPYEATLRPEFWAHVGAMFRIGDLIELAPEDGSYFALLQVRECGRLFAKVGEILFKDWGGAAVEETENSEFAVKWRGRYDKFSVVRSSDKLPIKTGFETREQAATYMLSHVKALAK